MKRILFTAILCLAGAAILPCGVGCESLKLQQQATTQPMSVTYTIRFDAFQKDFNFAKSAALLGATVATVFFNQPFAIPEVELRFGKAQAVINSSRKYAIQLDAAGELTEDKLTQIFTDIAAAMREAKL